MFNKYKQHTVILCLTHTLLCVVLCIFLPWWSISFSAFLLGIAFPSRHYKFVFLGGFASIFLLWFSIGLYIDLQNESILSSKVIQLFMLPATQSWLLLLFTGLVGGLVSGSAALIGKYISNHFIQISYYGTTQ